MKALRTIFALAALALVGSALALVQPQGYAGKSLLRAAHSVSFRGSSEGSPAAWTPASIAGLQLWLDASQITGLSDNDPVAAWDDLSGNANNATQGTASNRPTYKTNQLNGRPAVRLDGIDDWLTYTNDIFTYTGAGTVFALVKVNATQAMGYGSVLSVFGGVNQSIMACVQVYPNNAVEFCTDVYSPGGVRYNTTKSTSTWYLVTWTWSNWSTHKTNGSTKIRVNGVEGTVAAFGTNPSGLTVTRRAIGSTDLGGLSHLNGDIAALLAYNTQLTSDQISQVESYLNTQWGITFTPASIPGLQLWLDASQITGLNDGDAVSTWPDLSGNGRDYTQGTASFRPTYKTNQRGSLPAVLFDGIDDHLYATFSCTGKTVVCVFKITGGVQYNRPFNFAPSDTCLYRDTTNTRVGAYSGAFGPLLAGVSTGFLTAVWTFDNSGSNLRIDGVNATPVGGAFTTALSGTHTVSQMAHPHTGYVAHLLVYDTVISAGDIASLETYFSTH